MPEATLAVWTSPESCEIWLSPFSPEDIPGYVTSLVKDCPMCKAGQKIDALSNSYGFSPLT